MPDNTLQGFLTRTFNSLGDIRPWVQNAITQAYTNGLLSAEYQGLASYSAVVAGKTPVAYSGFNTSLGIWNGTLADLLVTWDPSQFYMLQNTNLGARLASDAVQAEIQATINSINQQAALMGVAPLSPDEINAVSEPLDRAASAQFAIQAEMPPVTLTDGAQANRIWAQEELGNFIYNTNIPTIGTLDTAYLASLSPADALAQVSQDSIAFETSITATFDMTSGEYSISLNGQGGIPLGTLVDQLRASEPQEVSNLGHALVSGIDISSLPDPGAYGDYPTWPSGPGGIGGCALESVEALQGTAAAAGYALMALDIVSSVYTAANQINNGDDSGAGQTLTELAFRTAYAVEFGVFGLVLGEIGGGLLASELGLTLGSAAVLSPTGGTNTLVLGPGLTAANVTFNVSGDDLLIGDGTAGDQIRIVDQEFGGRAAYQVQTLVYGDGTSISLTGGLTIVGASPNETLYGTPFGNDTFIGGAGNDTFYGGTGDDHLLPRGRE
jgi:hypothetical protein